MSSHDQQDVSTGQRRDERDAFPARRGDWMETFTGRRFWPLDPRAEDVSIEDIAHALSLLTRYGGHCTRFYSVAEHCVLLARAAPPEAALWLLLHDASEAYLSDMVRPLKRHMPEYRAAEDRVTRAVYQAFRLDPEMQPDAVKDLDCRIVMDERAQAMTPTGDTWNYGGAREPLGVTLQFWPPERAEREFLALYSELTGWSVEMPAALANHPLKVGERAPVEAFRAQALEAIQALRHRAAATFTPSHMGNEGQARCDSFYEAYEAVRMLAAAPTPTEATPSEGAEDTTLNARLKAAGMFTVPEMLGVTPLTKWIVPFGMKTLEDYAAWLDRRVAEFLRMKAGYELGDKPKDDELYEWVLAHSGALSEARTIFKAVYAPAARPAGEDAPREVIKAKAAEHRASAAECDGVGSYTSADQERAVAGAYEDALAIFSSLASPTQQAPDQGGEVETLSRQDWFKCEFAVSQLRMMDMEETALAVGKAARIADRLALRKQLAGLRPATPKANTGEA